MLPRSAPRRGISLIEVLLALTILVISLAGISQLVDIGSDHGNQARAATRGTRLAQGKMVEVEAGVVPLTSEASGNFEGDDAAWKFTVSPEPAGPPNLYTVTVRVSREIKGETFEIVLTQMIFDPTVMGSAAQAELPPTDSTTTTGTGGTTP
ncbi:Uncharacterized protein OS=Planctomyces maris DSM 8797 GN=PM8797T_14304 PE=4 SV=1 [Gemmata massiliana]|uniref:Prepilin-type N-terminal cleavage/methylation domain-containing protein n=1 Tax=Gemmata massiliana TaxID=1210884 RepID=A0A6P2CXJ8_9BACT|nr:prepilin-type N-terminal cleavage/methylation domain-containing protein [Gemmata massiliana]VTR91832.1 Uncharacterized protein OS=Planctomyces maris DSM 8797 GN=PM8797T_14304 PE=4 SV=1 [Gemmata massiliana]